MYFGRSIFQSVVERLQNENIEAQVEPMENRTPRTPDFISALSTNPLTDETHDPSDRDAGKDYIVPYYEDYGLDDDFLIDETPLSTAAEVAPVAEEVPVPAVDYSFLNASSLEAVQAELGLKTLTTVEKLLTKRRQFARDNHPDRVPIEWRAQATARMTAANQLIDQAIKEIALRSRLGI